MKKTERASTWTDMRHLIGILTLLFSIAAHADGPYWVEKFTHNDDFAKQSKALISKIHTYDDIQNAPFCVVIFTQFNIRFKTAKLSCVQTVTTNGYDQGCSWFKADLGTDHGGFDNGSLPGKCDQKNVDRLVSSMTGAELHPSIIANRRANTLNYAVYVYRDKFKSIKRLAKSNQK